MPIEKACEFCGKTFSVRPAKATHARFCGLVCQKAKREAGHATLKCLQCGSDFEVHRKRETGRKFCGTACMRLHETAYGRPAAQTDPIALSCRHCEKLFQIKPAYLAEYRRKYDKDPPYCSRGCAHAGRKALSDAKYRFTCIQCGKDLPVQRRPGGTLNREKRLCSTECRSLFRRLDYQARHPDAEATRSVVRNGYVRVIIPGKNGMPSRETFEHRWVMEQHIGRELLPEETVHHRDGNRQHNAIENLELFSSRHGPGQRVIDKVDFAIDMLLTYPEFAAAKGYKLVASDVDPASHISDATPGLRRAPC